MFLDGCVTVPRFRNGAFVNTSWDRSTRHRAHPKRNALGGKGFGGEVGTLTSLTQTTEYNENKTRRIQELDRKE